MDFKNVFESILHTENQIVRNTVLALSAIPDMADDQRNMWYNVVLRVKNPDILQKIHDHFIAEEAAVRPTVMQRVRFAAEHLRSIPLRAVEKEEIMHFLHSLKHKEEISLKFDEVELRQLEEEMERLFEEA